MMVDRIVLRLGVFALFSLAACSSSVDKSAEDTGSSATQRGDDTEGSGGGDDTAGSGGGDAPGDPERARRADGSEPWAPGPYAAFTLEPRGASLVGRGVPRGHIRLSFAIAEYLVSADMGALRGPRHVECAVVGAA